jgi:hypothetical protein
LMLQLPPPAKIKPATPASRAPKRATMRFVIEITSPLGGLGATGCDRGPPACEMPAGRGVGHPLPAGTSPGILRLAPSVVRSLLLVTDPRRGVVDPAQRGRATPFGGEARTQISLEPRLRPA